MWLAVLVVLLIGGLIIVKLFNYAITVGKEQLKAILDAIKKEKDAVVKQRASLNSEVISLNMMAKQMDATHKQVKNSIETVRALSERIHDPQWMRKFEEGRDNAPWN